MDLKAVFILLVMMGRLRADPDDHDRKMGSITQQAVDRYEYYFLIRGRLFDWGISIDNIEYKSILG